MSPRATGSLRHILSKVFCVTFCKGISLCHVQVTVFSFLFCSRDPGLVSLLNSLWLPRPPALSGKWEVFENRLGSRWIYQIIVPVSEWRLNAFIKFSGSRFHHHVSSDDHYEYLWVTNHVVSSESARKPVQYPEFIPGPRVIMTHCTLGNLEEGPG